MYSLSKQLKNIDENIDILDKKFNENIDDIELSNLEIELSNIKNKVKEMNKKQIIDFNKITYTDKYFLLY